jgi:hypothetical protein
MEGVKVMGSENSICHWWLGRWRKRAINPRRWTGHVIGFPLRTSRKEYSPAKTLILFQ